VEFRNVSKSYPIYQKPSARLKEIALFNRRSFHRDFWALRDVTFAIEPGETFCVIGENGSGKSTLLQIVAGILQPTQGEVSVRGRVAALLELGSGFNPEFTGRDNIYLNAAIFGLSRKEIDSKLDQIEAFAEIGDFIDQPVKTYSSGMAVRLAFSVAIHVDPEILLVDEALAVGDIYFHQRCMRKVHELREKGVTILFVSHSMAEVKAIGDHALWLEGGRVRDFGNTERVVTRYLAAMFEKDSAYLTTVHRRQQRNGNAPVRAPEVIETIPNIDHRFGDGRAEILGIAILDLAGQPIHLLEPLSAAIVRISVRAIQHIDLPIIGFIMRNHMGLDFAGTNTAREGFELPAMAAGDIHTVDFHLQLPELYPSSFSFSPAIAEGTLHAYTTCDWIDNAIVLQMSPSDGEVYGHLHLPCRIELNRRLAKAASPELSHAEPEVG
jgi:ABC-type polysaccharide/polyol phosphate transport system ATPase subunit